MTNTNDELQALLAACRKLMRSILSVSRSEEEQGGWPVRLRAAKNHVQEAVQTLNAAPGGASDGGSGSLDRIAATLTTRLVHDLMAERELNQARKVEARVAVTHDRDGFHGYTWAISLPDLMGFLQMQQKSGVLRINNGQEVVSLIFDEGDLIHACSDNAPPGSRLGEILVAQRAIDMERLEKFLVRYSAAPGRLGDALEAEGLITKEELRKALDNQIEQIFHRLFAGENAYYAFREGHAEDVVRMRLNVFQLLLETCRVRDEDSTDPAVRKAS